MRPCWQCTTAHTAQQTLHCNNRTRKNEVGRPFHGTVGRLASSRTGDWEHPQDLNYLYLLGNEPPPPPTRTTDTRTHGLGRALMRIASHSSIIRTPPTGHDRMVRLPHRHSAGQTIRAIRKRRCGCAQLAGCNAVFQRTYTANGLLMGEHQWHRQPDITIISERACRCPPRRSANRRANTRCPTADFGRLPNVGLTARSICAI